MNERPVHLIVSDDQMRNRLTVLLRLLLAIPHLVWLVVFSVAALLAGIANWVATLVSGRPPAALHSFLSAYVRYLVHLGAYLYLAANPYPGFFGAPGYPVDLEIGPPARQNRWTVAFRLILAIPAQMLASALYSSLGTRSNGINVTIGLAGCAALLGWFAALFTARMPRGLRDAAAYALGYVAQVDAYLLILTDRYPTSDPELVLPSLPVRTDPIRLHVEEPLRRSRLTVFFRLLLALPHLVWLTLWSIAAALVALVNWVATLITAQSPGWAHRFLAAFVRYHTHVYAYLYVVSNPFPGFVGAAGSYPLEVQIEPPRRQNRWIVLFRVVLAIPAMLLSAAWGSLLFVVALLGWFASLFTAQMPRGLRNLGAQALRYLAQFSGYLLILTDRYPYSGPSAGPAPVPAADTAPPLPA